MSEQVRPSHVALWISGDPPVASATSDLASADLTMAADGGMNHAVAAGLRVDVLVGDLDSVAPELLDDFSGEIIRYPVDKDFTDLELALGVAVERGASTVTVIGGGGGRIDHELAGLLALTRPQFAHCMIRARNGRSLVQVLRPSPAPTVVEGIPGEVVSIVPVGGDIEGVQSSGLRWELRDERLKFGATRGVSNELVDRYGEVEVAAGLALVIQPNHYR